MQIVILAGFMIAMTLQNAEALLASTSGYVVAPAVALYLLVAAALGRANTVLSLRAMGAASQGFPAAVRRHGLLMLLTQVWLLAGLAGIILLGLGRWLTDGLHLRVLPLSGKTAAMVPFVIGVLLVWIADYPFYRAVRQRLSAMSTGDDQSAQAIRAAWTLWQYVDYNTRHHLLFIAVPIVLISLTSDGLILLTSKLLPKDVADCVLPLAMLATCGAVFLVFPAIIVWIWRTRPLPAGPLRDGLESMCRRFGLRYRNILVWQTGGAIANAAVLGLLGRLRYVLLSDALLEQMDRRDVEAIFAHEAGHIMKHHILYALMFTVGIIAVCVLAVSAMMTALDWPEWAGDLAALGLIGAAWGSGFGWVSRRFERQSDVISAWASGQVDGGQDDRITHEGAAVFARALRRIADLNGIPVGKRTWRHGSIAQRISYVLWLGSTAATRRGDDRLVRRLKAGIWVLLAVAAVLGTVAAMAGWL